MSSSNRAESLLLLGGIVMIAGLGIAWLLRSPVLGVVVPLAGFALLLVAGTSLRARVRSWQIPVLTAAGIVGMLAMVGHKQGGLSLALGLAGGLLLLSAVLADTWHGAGHA